MDAVNEALNKPTEYPAADKTYDNPFFFKGTEPRDDRSDRQSSIRRRAEVDLHEGPQHGGNPNYLQRRHLDEEVKDEIDADLSDVPVRHQSRLLLPK